MVKYNMSMLRDAKRLFPNMTTLHDMMKAGDPKAVDVVYAKIGFMIDEDDVVRAFRNKKEHVLLETAMRARDIRDLYQKMFAAAEAREIKQAEKMGYQDCI